MNIHVKLGCSLVAASLMAGEAMAAETPYSQMVLGDTPFLYWNFDESSGDALQKIVYSPPDPNTPNELVPAGASRVSHSTLGSGLKLGNAADFSGSSYFMAEDLNLGINTVAAPWILEFWMQAQGGMDAQRNDYIMNFGGGGGNSPAVLYDYVGGAEPRNGIELFTGGRTGPGPLVADTSWHHVVMVFYGDGTTGVADRVDIYVDGTLAAGNVRNTFSSPINLGSRFVVGTSAPQFAAGDGFQGRVDEIAVYSAEAGATEATVTALAQQIAAHHAAATGTVPYEQVVLDDGPVAYWNFNEAEGNARQLAPLAGTESPNDLVVTGDVLRMGHQEVGSGLNLGRFVDFDGSSLMRAEDLSLSVTELAAPWAIEFWMQAIGPNEERRNDYLLSFGAQGGNQPAVIFDYIGAEQDDAIELFQIGGRTGSGPSVSDDQWHHVLIVGYGTDTAGVADRLEMYLDGVSQGQNIRNTYSRALNLGGQFIVGSSPVLADGFEGRMDEVAVYAFPGITTEAALTTKVNDIATRHNQLGRASSGNYTAAVLADNPVLYYNFEEVGGNAIQRAAVVTNPNTGQENNLKPSGTTRASHASIGSGLNLGNAAEFNGVNYFIAADLTPPKASLAGPWAVEFWLQVQGVNDGMRNDYIMNFGAGGGNRPAVLYDYIGGENADNGLELFAGGRTGPGVTIDDEQWHHALLVYYGDGTTGVADRVDFYMDGQKVAENIRNTFSSVLTTGSQFVVGTSAPEFAGGDGFEGRVDEIAIYDLSALTTEAAVTTKVSDLATRHYAAARTQGATVTVGIRKNGNQLVISWPASATGYILESTPTLTNPQWTTVSGTPVQNGENLELTVSLQGTTRFYRLRRQ